LSVARLPHHVIWRGLSDQTLFRDDEDRWQFLQCLTRQAEQHRVSLHAFVLLDHAVQCLCTPDMATGLGLMMQGIGRHYVRHFNGRHHRQGTLWEGRYRCTIVEPGEAELQIMCLLDSEPVHAGQVAAAEHYAWSSHAHYAGRVMQKGLTAPAIYWQLGNTPFAREAAYAERVAHGLPAEQRERLLSAALRGWVMGSPDFVEAVQAQVSRRVIKSRPGRPKVRPLQ